MAEITVTKANLVEEVNRRWQMDDSRGGARPTRSDSEEAVEIIFESIIGALQKGEKIEIRGFGSFRTRQRRARVGRNPKTGARVEVPPKRVPYFKPSRELKEYVNGGAPAAEPEPTRPEAPSAG